MKQMIWAFALACLMYSCGKEEPTPRPQIPQEENKQSETPKPDDSKDENKDDPKEDKLDDNSENKPNGENSDQPKEDTPQSVELKESELLSYFGLEKSLIVSQASELIGKVRGLKTIESKEIRIDEATVLVQDVEGGSLTVRIKGSIGEQVLEQTTDLSGFEKRPSSYTVGSRMQVRWKVPEDQYLDYIDLHALHIERQTDKFTTEYLAPVVEFYSSDTGGKIYRLSSKETERIELLDVKYIRGSIEFKTRFEGATSQTSLRLNFDNNAYYSRKVKVNLAPAKQWYMYGVADSKIMDIFMGEFFEYDSDKYFLVHNNTTANSSTNTAVVNFSVMSKRTVSVLGNVSKTISGFKPLTDLSKDLFLASTYDLVNYFKAKFRDLQEEQLKQRLQNSLHAWIKQVQVYHANPNIPLAWEQIDVQGGSVPGLSGRDGTKSKMHLYFLNPRFEVISAKKFDNKNLEVKLKLNFINDTAIEGVEYALYVPIY
ncbi:MAG: hypothetical protein Q4A61_01180 [Porphyromonadaceae bacterium]|nr:hypothetical protein [Porphyromonadaceae bacterium]